MRFATLFNQIYILLLETIKYTNKKNQNHTFHVFFGEGFLTDTKAPSAGFTTLQLYYTEENVTHVLRRHKSNTDVDCFKLKPPICKEN